MTGGNHFDTFIFAVGGEGNDTITDYGFGDQVIMGGFASYSELRAVSESSGEKWALEAGDTNGTISVSAVGVGGADLLVDFGNGNSITFEDTTQITTNDFLFFELA